MRKLLHWLMRLAWTVPAPPSSRSRVSARGRACTASLPARQKGMFSFSGLTAAQVAWLRAEKSIYIVGGGRINVAGITPANLEYLCTSMAAALRA